MLKQNSWTESNARPNPNFISGSNRQNSGNFLQIPASETINSDMRSSNQFFPINSLANTPHEFAVSQENHQNNPKPVSPKDISYYVRQLPNQMSSHS